MVFEPVSPIRKFPRAAYESKRRSVGSTSTPNMNMKRTSRSRSTKVARTCLDSSHVAAAIIPESPNSGADVQNQCSHSEGMPSRKLGTVETTPTFHQQLRDRRFSSLATDESPVDLSYVPTINPRGIIDAETLPPGPKVSRHTTAQSYFESDSSSIEDEEPVIGCANSARAVTPEIVHHSPSLRVRADHVRGSHDAASMLGNQYVTHVSDPTPSEEGQSASSVAHGSRAGSVPLVPGRLDGMAGASRRASITALPPTPTSLPDNYSLNAARTASDQASSIYSESMDESPSRNLRAAGGLFLNPPFEADLIAPRRSIKLPKPDKRLSKHVRIRPADIITHHENADQKVWRETVVSTPYPSRDHDFDSFRSSQSPNHSANDQVAGVRRAATIDRFPSPDQPEALFLDLGLAGHPAITTTLEILVTNKSCFDDEMLFRQIQASYNRHLLGLRRLPLRIIRSISHFTLITPVASSLKLSDATFDHTDFLEHFNRPSRGRKRKTWVIWLRNHNRVCTRHVSSLVSPHPSVRRDQNHYTVTKRPLGTNATNAISNMRCVPVNSHEQSHENSKMCSCCSPALAEKRNSIVNCYNPDQSCFSFSVPFSLPHLPSLNFLRASFSRSHGLSSTTLPSESGQHPSSHRQLNLSHKPNAQAEPSPALAQDFSATSSPKSFNCASLDKLTPSKIDGEPTTATTASTIHANGNHKGGAKQSQTSSESPEAKITTTPSSSPPPLPPAHPEYGTARVKIQIHHTFNLWTLFVIFALISLLVVSSVVLWVLFGVPGTGLGQHGQQYRQKTGQWSFVEPVPVLNPSLLNPDNSTTTTGAAVATDDSDGVLAPTSVTSGSLGLPALGVSGTRPWEIDAQARVLTGLMLGWMVLVLGVLAEIFLAWAGWVLL